MAAEAVGGAVVGGFKGMAFPCDPGVAVADVVVVGAVEGLVASGIVVTGAARGLSSSFSSTTLRPRAFRTRLMCSSAAVWALVFCFMTTPWHWEKERGQGVRMVKAVPFDEWKVLGCEASYSYHHTTPSVFPLKR